MLLTASLLAVSPQARLGAARRTYGGHRGELLMASVPPAEDPPLPAAALDKLRLLESNVEQLEARLAARRPDPAAARAGPTAVTPDFASPITAGDATTRPALQFDPASNDNSRQAIAVRGPGLYSSERGGLYLYVCDLTENSVGVAVAGAVFVSLLARGSQWWPLLSLMGAYAGALVAGTPSAAGRFLNLRVGRRVGLVVKGATDRVEELRLYYRTGKVGIMRIEPRPPARPPARPPGPASLTHLTSCGLPSAIRRCHIGGARYTPPGSGPRFVTGTWRRMCGGSSRPRALPSSAPSGSSRGTRSRRPQHSASRNSGRPCGFSGRSARRRRRSGQHQRRGGWR